MSKPRRMEAEVMMLNIIQGPDEQHGIAVLAKAESMTKQKGNLFEEDALISVVHLEMPD